MVPPKKPCNGEIKELTKELTEHEVDEIMENPTVQEFLRKKGKL